MRLRMSSVPTVTTTSTTATIAIAWHLLMLLLLSRLTGCHKCEEFSSFCVHCTVQRPASSIFGECVCVCVFYPICAHVKMAFIDFRVKRKFGIRENSILTLESGHLFLLCEHKTLQGFGLFLFMFRYSIVAQMKRALKHQNYSNAMHALAQE